MYTMTGSFLVPFDGDYQQEKQEFEHSQRLETRKKNYYNEISSVLSIYDRRDKLTQKDYFNILQKHLESSSNISHDFDKEPLNEHIFDNIEITKDDFCRVFSESVVALEEKMTQEEIDQDEKLLERYLKMKEKYKDERLNETGLSENATLKLSINNIKFQSKKFDDVSVTFAFGGIEKSTSKQDESYSWPGFFDFKLTSFSEVTVTVFSDDVKIGSCIVSIESYKCVNSFETTTKLFEIKDDSQNLVGVISLGMIVINSHLKYAIEGLKKFDNIHSDKLKTKKDYDQLLSLY